MILDDCRDLISRVIKTLGAAAYRGIEHVGSQPERRLWRRWYFWDYVKNYFLTKMEEKQMKSKVIGWNINQRSGMGKGFHSL